MESALIVCSSSKGTDFYRDFLIQNGCQNVSVVGNGDEARRRLVEQDYDICLVNAPLPTESGEELSIDIAEKNVCQVILFVKAEVMEEITEKVEDFGIITVSKPISRQMFWSALKLAKVAQRRIRMAQKETQRLQHKIDDLKLVSKAKCVLIEYENMSEEEAHKYIEKHAMDARLTRVEIAREILALYA